MAKTNELQELPVEIPEKQVAAADPLVAANVDTELEDGDIDMMQRVETEVKESLTLYVPNQQTNDITLECGCSISDIRSCPSARIIKVLLIRVDKWMNAPNSDNEPQSDSTKTIYRNKSVDGGHQSSTQDHQQRHSQYRCPFVVPSLSVVNLHVLSRPCPIPLPHQKGRAIRLQTPMRCQDLYGLYEDMCRILCHTAESRQRGN